MESNTPPPNCLVGQALGKRPNSSPISFWRTQNPKSAICTLYFGFRILQFLPMFGFCIGYTWLGSADSQTICEIEACSWTSHAYKMHLLHKQGGLSSWTTMPKICMSVIYIQILLVTSYRRLDFTAALAKSIVFCSRHIPHLFQCLGFPEHWAEDAPLFRSPRVEACWIVTAWCNSSLLECAKLCKHFIAYSTCFQRITWQLCPIVD